MSKIRSIVAAQSSVGEPEHRGDERSEAARSGGSPTFEPESCPLFLIPKFPRATRVTTASSWTSSGGQTPVGGTASWDNSCGRRGSTPRTWARGVSNARPG